MTDNPAAFPCTGEGFGNPHYTQHGMTLRDYFAGQALPATLTALANGQHGVQPGKSVIETAAVDSYAVADAMLLARQSGENRRDA